MQVFAAAAANHGFPAAFLADNAAAFSGEYRGGRVLESELARLGIPRGARARLSPADLSKVERFQLIAGTDVRVIRENGQLLGEATLDASRNYQPLRRPAIVHDLPRQVSSIT